MTTRTFADQSVIKNFVDIRSRALFTPLSQTFCNNNTFENPIFWYCVRIHVLNPPPLQSSVKQSVTMSARAESLNKQFLQLPLLLSIWKSSCGSRWSRHKLAGPRQRLTSLCDFMFLHIFGIAFYYIYLSKKRTIEGISVS